MGKKVVSRCRVWVNGKEVTYFKNWSKDERKLRERVKLMGGFATMDLTADHLFSLDYVLQKGTPIDWENFEDGTVAVQMEGGEKYLYQPASVLSVGKQTVDQQSEPVQTIMFAADNLSKS